MNTSALRKSEQVECQLPLGTGYVQGKSQEGMEMWRETDGQTASIALEFSYSIVTQNVVLFRLDMRLKMCV